MTPTIPLNLNRRTSAIAPAATSGLSERIAQLKAQGQDIIGLSTGEPDFDTPEHIRRAAIQAIEAGQTRYPPTGGTSDLKQAIVAKLQRENGFGFQTNEVFVANGAKQVLFNFLQTLVDDGEEVIFSAPYWVSYPEMVKAVGGKSVIVNTTLEQGFKMTPEQLRQAITTNTKAVIFCSPNNPSGTAYSRSELAMLAEVLLEHPHVWVISDDIYEHLLWEEAGQSHLLSVCPALRSRMLIVNGVSKAYAMTGWRIGYGAGPEAIVRQAVRFQSHSTSGACSIAQAAAVAALNGPMTEIVAMKDAFKARHDYLFDALQKFRFIRCKPSDGTFYLFVDVSNWIEQVEGVTSDTEFVEYMIERAGVAVVPGSAFGAPGHLRFSFAKDMNTLKDVVNRLQDLEMDVYRAA